MTKPPTTPIQTTPMAIFRERSLAAEECDGFGATGSTGTDCPLVHDGPVGLIAGLADRIELRIGPALDTLRALPAAADIDLAFIDADKPGYAAYWAELVPRVRPGGLLLADNVLWSGQITDPGVTDANTTALRAFNDLVASDDRVETVVLTAFDGLTIARRR